MRRRYERGPLGTTVAGLREEVIQRERTECVRALLQRPLIAAGTEHPDAADDLRKIRRHETWLRAWFMDEAGWRLAVNADCARLYKSPARLDDGSRAARHKNVAFTQRRYVLLCLTLAVLERSGRQTILGRVADEVMRLSESDPAFTAAGITFDFRTRDQRQDMAAVARLLFKWGVLRREQGTEDAYVTGGSEDVLYTIRRGVLAHFMAVERGPSLVADDTPAGLRTEAIRREVAPESEEGRRARLRHALGRRLLDDPLMYFDGLPEELLKYYQSQRARALAELTRYTGLQAEVRRDGVALVDPDAELTDHPMPEEGTNGHVALLLAEHLAGALRRDRNAVFTEEALEAHLLDLVERYGRHWRKNMREPGVVRELLSETLDIFAALGLTLRDQERNIRPLPAIGRYGLLEPAIEEDPL